MSNRSTPCCVPRRDAPRLAGNCDLQAGHRNDTSSSGYRWRVRAGPGDLPAPGTPGQHGRGSHIDLAAAKAVAAGIGAEGGEALAVCVDVADRPSVDAAMNRSRRTWPDRDFLWSRARRSPGSPRSSKSRSSNGTEFSRSTSPAPSTAPTRNTRHGRRELGADRDAVVIGRPDWDRGPGARMRHRKGA